MKFSLTPVACAAALAVWSAPVLANDAAAPFEDAAQLSAVTVTAKGYAADAVDTPAAVTVLTAQDVARKQAHTVGEALNGEPGLSVSSDSAQGQNPVIRGLSRESVVLLVDGMRINSGQPAGAVASSMSLGLAEQVEVVKGPSSVLYGTGALGGAIHVRMPQARFDSGVQWRTHAGFDSASRGGNAAVVMNASGGDHALMLGGAAGSWGDYHSPEGKVARTAYDSRTVIGQYRYRIDDTQQLRLTLQQQRDDDLWYPGSTRPHKLPKVGSTTVHSPRQERRLYEIGYSRARTARQPLGLDVRLYRQEIHRRIFGYGNALGRDIVTNTVNFATTGLDARAEWLAHPQHLLSMGLNTWQMKASPNRYQGQPPAFTQFVRNVPFDNGRLQATGLYVQDDMQFGRWHVLAGLRHDWVKGGADSMRNGAVTQNLSRSDGATSGSVGVMYEAAPLLRPYINISRGFRAADMRERYESGLRIDGSFYAGNPRIKPETATQFEIGLKGSAAHLDYAVALYRNRISNYITGRPLTGAAAIATCGAANAAICRENTNLGSVRLQGVDASVRWQVALGHWLSAMYSRVRGDNRDLHEPLYRMPADSLTLGWTGRVTPQWTLDAQLRMVARQNRVATQFARGTEDATKGYTTLNLGATWQYRPNQSLRIAVKNATNRRYHEHLAEGLPGTEIQAPGRSIALSWDAYF